MSASTSAASAAPEVLAGLDAFTSDAYNAFDIYLETSKNRNIFDATKRAQYRNWLENPRASVNKMLSKNAQHRLRCEKRRCLQNFHLKNHQLYRNAEKSYGARVVATTYDAAQHIKRIHKADRHNGVHKTHQKVLEEIYSIS